MGDEVTILTERHDADADDSQLTGGVTITIGEDGSTIDEVPLQERNYAYVFVVTDCYGRTFYSSTAEFLLDPAQAIDTAEGLHYAGPVVAIHE